MSYTAIVAVLAAAVSVLANAAVSAQEPTLIDIDVDSSLIVETRTLSDEELESVETLDLPKLGFGDWLGYNSTDSDWTWIAAGDDLGMFSIESYPTMAVGEHFNIETGTGIHFLSGPGVTDLPPRLFDAQVAMSSRKLIADSTMLDLKVGVGVFSDFEGSARKGIRFPGHAVFYHELDPWLVSVLGVDVLDRDDISVLPVVGMIWRPTKDFVFEAVFPRPRLQFLVTEDTSFYISGELGGGTWAIERNPAADDVVTYRDLRVAFGLLKWGTSSETVLEAGYVFARSLEYRSMIGDYEPDSSFMLRLRSFF